MESRREANKRKCRQKILKASRRLFKDVGYENTMIEDVASRAEISKATLYNYFPNKDSLLLGTLDEVAVSFKKFLEGMEAEDTKDRIRKALYFLILDSVQFISVSRRILFLSANEDSSLHLKINVIKEMFAEMVQQGKEENLFYNEASTAEIVDQIMSVYLMSQFQWDDIERLSSEECVKRINKMLDYSLASFYKN